MFVCETKQQYILYKSVCVHYASVHKQYMVNTILVVRFGTHEGGRSIEAVEKLAVCDECK